MFKKAAIFSTERRPGRGVRISIMPDPYNIGIVEVVDVSKIYRDGSWKMKVKDESGKTRIISSKTFNYWIKEQETTESQEGLGTLKDYLLPGVGETTGPIDITDFEEGLSQTSSWLSKTMRFSSSDKV